MRKVECKKIEYEMNGSIRNKREVMVTGLFHQWGVNYEEFETGAGNYTVGIIELDDGTVEALLPNQIKFITAA
ncbi:hypothetical protein [Hafnia paralvei]|uniref:hypothetical protein n=1 Tax=Hafnia paralvei TaxID=546367 RepID=UPI003C2FDEFA